VHDKQVECAELKPNPIPQTWVLSGAPYARSAELSRSRDGSRVTLLWDCTAGDYLRRYGTNVTVEILEGEALVDDGGGPRLLRAGAQARFRAGSVARWSVPIYVKKLAASHDPRPRALRAALRLARKLRQLGTYGPDAEPSHV
jgi:uncharacterized cupin superfamily protein